MALALLLSAALLAWVTYRHLQGEQVRSAEQGASLLIENLAPTLAFKDPVAADRVLRGLRATKILTTLVVRRRAEHTVLAGSLVVLLLLVFSSIAVLHFENTPEANIKTAEDAIWWALATITTAGYGDR